MTHRLHGFRELRLHRSLGCLGLRRLLVQRLLRSTRLLCLELCGGLRRNRLALLLEQRRLRLDRLRLLLLVVLLRRHRLRLLLGEHGLRLAQRPPRGLVLSLAAAVASQYFLTRTDITTKI
jgi:hypothetical protein